MDDEFDATDRLPGSITSKFDTSPDGTKPPRWKIVCKTCQRAWTLPRAPVHPGNILALLNHAASHEEEE